VRPQLDGQGARQPRQAGLGGAVERVVLQRPLGVDVGDVHDGAARQGQVRGRRLGQEQRRLEVGADEVVPFALADRAERRGEEAGGIVHQRIEAAEVPGDLLDQPRQVVVVQQVGLEGHGRSRSAPH
jgi:hypothetical protein